MPENPHRSADEISDALAWVCARIEDIRRDLRYGADSGQTGDPEPLKRVLDSFRAGSDLADPLQGLHHALLRVGDPLGVWGHVRPHSRSVTLAGADNGTPYEPVYRCPTGRCAGRTPDNTTEFPLVCAMTGRELLQETL